MMEVTYLMSEIDASLNEIKVSQLVSYLGRSGFNTIESKYDDFLAFQQTVQGGDEPITLVFPTNESDEDYSYYMRRLVKTLHLVQGMDVDEVVSAILATDTDVFLTTVKGMKGSSLPLPYAGEFVNGLVDLFGYCALSIGREVPVHKTGVKGTAGRFVKGLRFCQTYAGSFGFRIESDLGAIRTAEEIAEEKKQKKEQKEKEAQAGDQAESPDEVAKVEPRPSYERRVFLRVYRGLQQAKESELQKSPNPIIDGFKTGLNANMCKALVNVLSHIEKPSVDYRVHWSPKETIHQSFRNSIELTSNAIPYIQDAYEALSDYDQVSEYVTVEGEVTTLNKVTTKEEPDYIGRERKIEIDGTTNKSSLRHKYLVYLPPDDYLMAFEAQKTHQMVRITGQLKKYGGRFWIEQPEKLEVVSASRL